MKKHIKKILILIILWIIIFSSIINYTSVETQDLTVSISTNDGTYLVGDNIEVKIKLSGYFKY